MDNNAILTLSDELLERYRSSIPRKAFEQFVEGITTGLAATAAPKFDASLLCRASFPAELEDDGGRCIVEVTVYRLNAVAVNTFLLDGPEPLRQHLGLSEADRGGTSMAALKEIAREYASEIRDGIGWVIVYRTGRSWHALTVWSDLGNNEWETDDINDALEALRLDPRAVALNGYYLGHFGDMTIDDIAAGIRYHYERGTNALADDDILTQARADIEAARQQAAEAGLPFSERLVDGPEDELDHYAYDGSMTVADYEATQRARDAHAALVEVVTGHYPNADEEAIERIAEAASSMKLSPAAVQRILDAFDRITETIKALCEWAAQTIRTLADFFTETLGDFMLRRAPPKWRHYALHAKRARVRKKYRNRIRRAFFAALASEGGGSS